MITDQKCQLEKNIFVLKDISLNLVGYCLVGSSKGRFDRGWWNYRDFNIGS
jgi:hypothetical protein